MPNRTSVFQRAYFKIFSLTFACLVLAFSVLFSQSNSEKDENLKKTPTMFNSSKSISPKLHKKENIKPQEEQKQIQEQPNINSKENPKIKEQKEETKVDNKLKKQKKKSQIIMPSSKAPDPEIYLQP